MDSIKPILDKVKKEIVPKKPNVDSFLKKINDLLKDLNAEAVIGGSFAKNTFLNNHDVDIFIKFDLKYKDKDISNLTEKALKVIGLTRVHGSRDYFQKEKNIKNTKLKFELVPVLNIKTPEDAINVTDFSPLHVDWVNKKGKDFKDDIRLAKKFCKASKTYGAESYIQGFSGHVLDILIIHYKGFLNFLKQVSLWKKTVVVDPENYYKSKNILSSINRSKTEGPLVVIDPIQKDRNAAAALADEKFFKLIQTAKDFLKNPSIDFFKEKELNKKELKKKGAILIEALSKDGKEDVVGSKLKKVFDYLKQELQDYNILESDWEWKPSRPAIMYFILEKQELPKEFERLGPPLSQKIHVDSFKEKNKNTFERNNKLYAKIKRKFTNPQDLINHILEKKIIKEKVKKICLI